MLPVIRLELGANWTDMSSEGLRVNLRSATTWVSFKIISSLTKEECLYC